MLTIRLVVLLQMCKGAIILFINKIREMRRWAICDDQEVFEYLCGMHFFVGFYTTRFEKE